MSSLPASCVAELQKFDRFVTPECASLAASGTAGFDPSLGGIQPTNTFVGGVPTPGSNNGFPTGNFNNPNGFSPGNNPTGFNNGFPNNSPTVNPSSTFQPPPPPQQQQPTSSSILQSKGAVFGLSFGLATVVTVALIAAVVFVRIRNKRKNKGVDAVITAPIKSRNASAVSDQSLVPKGMYPVAEGNVNRNSVGTTASASASSYLAVPNEGDSSGPRQWPRGRGLSAVKPGQVLPETEVYGAV